MQRLGAMRVVPVAIISLLLVVAVGTAVGGARHASAATTTTAPSRVLGFSTASEVVAYWQAVLPHAPMPSAITDRVVVTTTTIAEPGEPSHHHPAAETTQTRAEQEQSSSKILLPEDVFVTAGSVIDLYIDSSATLRTACKTSHDVADSVPMSAADLAGIQARYAPAAASLAVARDIWSTLNACSRLPVSNTGAGERRRCTASVRTMVEFAAAVLGTRNLRAFSSSGDVPADGVTVVPAPRYRIVAVRPVTAAVPGSPEKKKNGTSMTCHSMEFPRPAYYCHALNPTRVYEATLWREEEAEEEEADMAAPPRMMRAIAVCHVDSSGFDPEMSFFVERGIKPGDAPACHFLSRKSVLWAPAADVDGTAAATILSY